MSAVDDALVEPEDEYEDEDEGGDAWRYVPCAEWCECGNQDCVACPECGDIFGACPCEL